MELTGWSTNVCWTHARRTHEEETTYGANKSPPLVYIGQLPACTDDLVLYLISNFVVSLCLALRRALFDPAFFHRSIFSGLIFKNMRLLLKWSKDFPKPKRGKKKIYLIFYSAYMQKCAEWWPHTHTHTHTHEWNQEKLSLLNCTDWIFASSLFIFLRIFSKKYQKE